MENKAAYYQAELQIAASIRRLRKAWEILDDQCVDGNKHCEEVRTDVSVAIVRAKAVLSEVRRLKHEQSRI